MVKKIENRNIDVTKARGELEEDLLEYVYRTWRQGRQITSKEYAREVNITGYEAAGLVRSLVKKGFLCEPESGHLELSKDVVKFLPAPSYLHSLHSRHRFCKSFS